MNVKVIIAAHKPYWVPASSIYFPLHVGAEGKKHFDFQGDNSGDHISLKNMNYCELTGLYWAWKNLQYNYLGLVHYRRHFASHNAWFNKKKSVLSSTQVENLLRKYDVIVPPKRKYYIETNYSHYANAHHEEDLLATFSVLTAYYPEYIQSWNAIMSRSSGHRFNMFIMRCELADAYCEWLFDVLALVERRLVISEYSDYDARVFGFLGERLLDVWLEYHKIDYHEQRLVYLETQNWPQKIFSFLCRKLMRKKR